MYLNLKQNQQN